MNTNVTLNIGLCGTSSNNPFWGEIKLIMKKPKKFTDGFKKLSLQDQMKEFSNEGKKRLLIDNELSELGILEECLIENAELNIEDAKYKEVMDKYKEVVDKYQMNKEKSSELLIDIFVKNILGFDKKDSDKKDSDEKLKKEFRERFEKNLKVSTKNNIFHYIHYYGKSKNSEESEESKYLKDLIYGKDHKSAEFKKVQKKLQKKINEGEVEILGNKLSWSGVGTNGGLLGNVLGNLYGFGIEERAEITAAIIIETLKKGKKLDLNIIGHSRGCIATVKALLKVQKFMDEGLKDPEKKQKYNEYNEYKENLNVNLVSMDPVAGNWRLTPEDISFTKDLKKLKSCSIVKKHLVFVALESQRSFAKLRNGAGLFNTAIPEVHPDTETIVVPVMAIHGKVVEDISGNNKISNMIFNFFNMKPIEEKNQSKDAFEEAPFKKNIKELEIKGLLKKAKGKKVKGVNEQIYKKKIDVGRKGYIEVYFTLDYANGGIGTLLPESEKKLKKAMIRSGTIGKNVHVVNNEGDYKKVMKYLDVKNKEEDSLKNRKSLNNSLKRSLLNQSMLNRSPLNQSSNDIFNTLILGEGITSELKAKAKVALFTIVGLFTGFAAGIFTASAFGANVSSLSFLGSAGIAKGAGVIVAAVGGGTLGIGLVVALGVVALGLVAYCGYKTFKSYSEYKNCANTEKSFENEKGNEEKRGMGNDSKNPNYNDNVLENRKQWQKKIENSSNKNIYRNINLEKYKL